LFSVLSDFIMLCVGIIFFTFVLLGVCRAWSYGVMPFISFGKFLATASLSVNSAPLEKDFPFQRTHKLKSICIISYLLFLLAFSQNLVEFPWHCFNGKCNLCLCVPKFSFY
jgi:hypothetical protein